MTESSAVKCIIVFFPDVDGQDEWRWFDLDNSFGGKATTLKACQENAFSHGRIPIDDSVMSQDSYKEWLKYESVLKNF